MERARALGLLLAIVGVFALAACDDSSLPPGGTYQAVSGIVLDAATNQPVAGATVTIDTVLTSTTDASGKFTFAKVPVGDFDYTVATPNGTFKPYASSAHLAPDKPLALTITLSH
ncbi:MAG TPA: carboxypeptidase regulatory-like domain-containing protein [Candidatus Baltobacteraceae bacterium]|nr:carboxypeptidase regulatory-like domain-containing protein [Candidatus Baltobacteraceae bacterium]